MMARVTGLEPATSGVTGRRSNRLSYTRVFGVAGHLRAGLWSVNHCRLHFLPLVFFFLIRVADMSQRAVLEQEASDVGRARGGENGLHDDQQGDRQQRAGRSPDPGPE